MNKKKLRWAFEGQDDDGNMEFPKSFVKIDRRPTFPYSLVADEEGGHAEPVSGEIRVRQFVEKEEAIPFFLEAAKRITKGTLCCLGGGFFLDGDQLGYEEPDEDKVWEEWSLEGLEMWPMSIEKESECYYAYFVDGQDTITTDGLVIDWIVKYTWSEWKHGDNLGNPGITKL
jgi:hypothetical protein